jgi:DMSO/TMAO reductase YedYZ heme-binding membrane subunit
MLFIIALCVVAVLLFLLRGSIKNHGNLYYAAAVALCALTVAATLHSTFHSAPLWVRSYIVGLFDRGALGVALLTAVMYLGALPNTSVFVRKFMPVRTQLSIMASILIFGHNISYGTVYFRFLFTNPGRLPVTQVVAAIFTILMLAMLIPLFVTSFPVVRRKFKGTTWKKLHRMAYVFYMMIYGHILLLTLPGAVAGKSAYIASVAVYSAVFLGYAILRIRKAAKAAGRRRSLAVAA